MISFQDAIGSLGKATAAVVLGLWRTPESELAREEFVTAAASALARGNVQGVRLALDHLDGWLISQGADPADVTEVDLVADRLVDLDRLEKAVSTSISDDEQALDRLERLARAEPVEAAQRAFEEAMGASPQIEGWRRVLEPGACQLCRWWERDGRIWPKSHTMPTHKRCECVQQPVLTDQALKKISRKAARDSAARERFGSLEDRKRVDATEYSNRALGRTSK